MKKLKTKTFYTLFIILSCFLTTILFIFNYQNYDKEKEEISRNLLRMNTLNMNIGRRENQSIPNEENKNQNLDQRIFLDNEVYTILLDYKNTITSIIHHSEIQTSNNIRNVALEIISNEKKDTIKIKNIYFEKYSYNYKSNRYLIIIDNSSAQERLFSMLETSIIIFIVFELVFLILSRMITEWLTKPATESFEKQKEFIADASHELKTPLTIIMANTEALENDRNEQKWLNNIKLETEKMSHLITGLLDLSKLESNESKEDHNKNDLSKLIEKSVLTFESLAYESDVKIQTEIQKEIFMTCNQLEINELISILLDNAIKHSKKRTKIKVNLSKIKEEIIIEVINKGDEIPKEECEKIFERFYRVDKSRNRNSNRYGLGLAIAKTIVLNHSGKISAFSKDGYTTFKVVFKSKKV